MHNTLEELDANGYKLIESVYTAQQVEHLVAAIEGANTNADTFRKAPALFAIRRLLHEVPELNDMVFTPALLQLIKWMGPGYFVSKAIYFDKPADANWPVAMHRDLTIAVAEKQDVTGYGPWSVKPGQFGVQPPLALLRDNFTIRIHLDDTTADNGALYVVPGSHMDAVAMLTDVRAVNRICCPVGRGGVMVMRPMLLHASGRTVNGQPRRVVHIEFSRVSLPLPLQWAEKIELNY